MAYQVVTHKGPVSMKMRTEEQAIEWLWSWVAHCRNRPVNKFRRDQRLNEIQLTRASMRVLRIVQVP